jgi:hypothetical protein
LLFATLLQTFSDAFLGLSFRATEVVCNLIEGREPIQLIIAKLCVKGNCDVPQWLPTLVAALKHNRLMNADLAGQIAEQFMRLLGKQVVPNDSEFEAAFLDPWYVEVTRPIFFTHLCKKAMKYENNEVYFRWFERSVKFINDVAFFQKLLQYLLIHVMSVNSYVASFTLKLLNELEDINFILPPEFADLDTHEHFRVVSKFFDRFVLKVGFDASVVICGQLIELFSHTTKRNRLAVTGFFNCVFRELASESIQQSQHLVPSYIKATRSMGLKRNHLTFASYQDYLIALFAVNAPRVLAVMIEHGSFKDISNITIRALFDLQPFILAFFEFLEALLKGKPSFQTVQQCADILYLFVHERLAD